MHKNYWGSKAEPFIIHKKQDPFRNLSLHFKKKKTISENSSHVKIKTSYTIVFLFFLIEYLNLNLIIFMELHKLHINNVHTLMHYNIFSKNLIQRQLQLFSLSLSVFSTMAWWKFSFWPKYLCISW